MPTSSNLKKYPKLIEAEIETVLQARSAIPNAVKPSRNKEFFYFVALVFSALFLGFIFVIGNLSELQIQGISQFLEAVPFLDLKLSTELIEDLRMPKPVTKTLLTGNFLFLGFILVDLFRKDEIRRDGSKDLFKESSSASFSLHLLILLILLLSLLLNWHPKPQVKVTRIEFIPTQTPSKKAPPKNTSKRAMQQSIDSGKHDPKKPVTPETKPSGKPSLPPSAQQKPAEPKPAPKPSLPKPKAATSQETPAPSAAPKPAPSSNKPIAAPKPKALRDAINPIKEDPGPLKPLPKLMDYGSANSTGAGATSGSSSPAPKSSADAGSVSGRGSDLVARLSNIPRAPDALSGTGDGGAYGASGNPPPNAYPDRAPSVAAQADLNMGPYMAALQRKIKRAWKPPRGTESNRIVATFRVRRDGTLVDLKLIVKCDYPEANLAALEAISNAAPFDPLPAGSAETVDIEFTFDYNVFQKTRW